VFSSDAGISEVFYCLYPETILIHPLCCSTAFFCSGTFTSIMSCCVFSSLKSKKYKPPLLRLRFWKNNLEIKKFGENVVKDQSAQIEQMKAMLKRLG
jgi:hypothetical protein